jgi:hypothetical protein
MRSRFKKYTLIPINRETRISERHMEGHSVRYVPELELIAAYSGFEIVGSRASLTSCVKRLRPKRSSYAMPGLAD